MLNQAKIIFLMVFLSFSFRAFPSFNNLALEFLETNKDVLKLKSSMLLSQLDVESVKSAKSWNALYNYTRDKSNLEASTLTVSEALAEVHTLSLSRSNFFGGTFSVDNSYTLLDRKSLSPAKLYEFNQSVTYKQTLGKNFFGREDRLSLELFEKKYQLTSVSVEDSLQTALLTFYKAYESASLSKTLLGLQKEALERAVKRRELITKRVRDGLREKVDLYQAEMSELSQIEALKSAENDFRSAIESMGILLHRPISTNEIEAISMEKVVLKDVMTGKSEENLSLKAKKVELELSKRSLEKARYGFIPSMDLSAKYKTNDYDPRSSETLNKGTFGNKNDEVVIAFNLLWPLGFNSQKVEVEKEAITLKYSELENEKLLANFSESEKTLNTHIQKLDENIVTVKARHKLAQKVLQEYSKLYNISKADLDQVIRSEEDLISTERSMVTYIAKRKILFAELSALYGKLKKNILE